MLLLPYQNIKFMKKYECDLCGYVYDPAEGDPDNGVAPGTAFEDIPEGGCARCVGPGKKIFPLYRLCLSCREGW